tara:strand:- start:2469 stop:3050 length:582 start_codon:yes stop_codon:yes gene_type:complete
MKTIVDLCSGSGNWSRPYLDAGYNVIQVEWNDGWDARLFPSPTSPTSRLPRDFDDIRNMNVHGVLAAPPCTVFSGSGARWERSDAEVTEGLSVVDACLRIVLATKPRWWVLENPVGKLVKWIGNPVDSFHPNDYGDTYTKKTLLWGDFNMPPKHPVEATEGSKLWLLPPSEKRAALRSVTPMGFSRAFFEANP